MAMASTTHKLGNGATGVVGEAAGMVGVVASIRLDVSLSVGDSGDGEAKTVVFAAEKKLLMLREGRVLRVSVRLLRLLGTGLIEGVVDLVVAEVLLCWVKRNTLGLVLDRTSADCSSIQAISFMIM